MPNVAGMDPCNLSLQDDVVALLMQTLEQYNFFTVDGNLIRSNLRWPSPAGEVNAYISSLSSGEHMNPFTAPVLNPPPANISGVETN